MRMTQYRNSSICDGGDPHVGIDRFGQLEDVPWNEISNAAHWKEHLQFGYNKAGNRLCRENMMFPGSESALYAYDGLYQFTTQDR